MAVNKNFKLLVVKVVLFWKDFSEASSYMQGNFLLKWLNVMKCYTILYCFLLFIGFWVCLSAVSAATLAGLGCAQCCQLYTVLSNWYGLLVPHMLFHQCICQSVATGPVSFWCKHIGKHNIRASIKHSDINPNIWAWCVDVLL